MVTGGEALVVHLDSEIECLNVCGHLPCIVICAQESSDELVHADRFGARQLDRAVQRFLNGNIGQRGSDIVRRDWLHHSGWQSNRVPVACRFGDAPHELKELRRTNDRIRNARSLDQVFLRHLRAEVTTRQQALGADDRQCHVMPHFGGRFRSQEIAPDVSKNSMTALSSHDGEFATSTTTSAPVSASAKSLTGESIHAR